MAIDELLEEAARRPMFGWDFSWLGDRLMTTPLPWQFEDLVQRRSVTSPDILDLGTGGGEWLARLPSRPPRTVATEAWTPNVSVATARLAPLGIEVKEVTPAADNADQTGTTGDADLPFPNGSFNLIVDRHESFVAREVARVLTPGGCFLTQQVADSGADDLRSLLGLDRPPGRAREWSLGLAIEQVGGAGLTIIGSGQGNQLVSFRDAAALAWYFKSCPWWCGAFDIHASRDALLRIQRRVERHGPVTIRQPHFWLESVKPLE